MCLKIMSHPDMAAWHPEMLCWHERVMEFGSLMSVNTRKKLLLWMFNEIYKALNASQGWDEASTYHVDLLEACYLLAEDDEDLMSASIGLFNMLGISVIEYSPKNGRMHTTVLMEDKTNTKKVILTGFIVYR